MTKNKRFTTSNGVFYIDNYLCGFEDLEGNECEIRCDGKPMTYREVTDLLNELTEENKQLRHDLEIYEENNINEVLNQLKIELTSRLKDCIEEFKE